MGSTSSGGVPEDASVTDAFVVEAGATDSGLDSTAEGDSLGADVTIVDAGAAEEAAADAGADATGADAPATSMDGGHAGAEAGVLDATIADAGAEASAPCVNLTVLNYEVWCAVSVNGGDAEVADAETLCVPPGTQQLAATALQFFELGPAPWHDTAGDMGQGDPGTVTGSGATAVDTTTVVVGSQPKCVWVCCPFDDGSGCPTTDQCPP
jgi:hypothetical protein